MAARAMSAGRLATLTPLLLLSLVALSLVLVALPVAQAGECMLMQNCPEDAQHRHGDLGLLSSGANSAALGALHGR